MTTWPKRHKTTIKNWELLPSIDTEYIALTQGVVRGTPGLHRPDGQDSGATEDPTSEIPGM